MSVKILVVDDEPDFEPLLKLKFREKIKNSEYELFFAINGYDALSKLNDIKDIEIMLTDINMPGMDGLTLLTEVNKLNLNLKSIVVSAYGDMDKIRKAMNNGAFDFLSKPLDFVDMEITLDKTIKAIQVLKEIEKTKKELEAIEKQALENKIKFEAEEEKLHCTEFLRESLKLMTSTFDINEIYTLMLTRLSKIIDFSHGISFSKISEESEEYSPVSTVGEIKLPLDNHTFNNICKEYCGKNNICSFENKDEFIFGDNSTICLPVNYNKKTLGVLSVLDLKINGHKESKYSVIKTFMEQSAVALQNSILFNEINFYATTDLLTGLYNRRYFLELASHEYKRAKRYGNGFSILMIDIDHFKHFNDQYGHKTGDEVLRFLGTIIKKVLRDSDLAGRFGGEEFLILLTDIDDQNTELIAERLRSKIEESALNIPEFGDLKVTISIGVSFYSEIISLDKMIENADKALYLAKENGRNRVEIYK